LKYARAASAKLNYFRKFQQKKKSRHSLGNLPVLPPRPRCACFIIRSCK